MIRPYYKLDDDAGGGMYSRPRIRIGSPLTPGVKWIIFACIGVFLLQNVMRLRSPETYDAFKTLFAFSPRLALGRGFVWQLVTYMLLHYDFWHIALNLFFLWMIGGLVEGRLGTRRFMWLFVLSGVAGAMAQALAFPNAATIGASAGIMSVAAAVGMLYPDMIILLFFIIPMKMKHFIWVLVALTILGTSGSGDTTAYFAHLAGLGMGYLFVKFEPRITRRLMTFYYGARGRYGGFVGGDKVTHINDDDAYRQEVDRLLDKIFREGTQSLSTEESDFLKKQSDKFKAK